jgi:putative adhesin
MRASWTIVGTGVVLAATAVPVAAQTDFQWRGRLSTGQAIEIKGVNGDVSATPSSSGEVEVTATKSARRSNPADVRIEVVQSPSGVTICAVYPSVPGKEPNQCVAGDGGRMNTQNNDTQVHFDVRVPAGVAFEGHTVNGEINAESLQSDVDAHTVNGSIRVTTSAGATASTVNGSVNVTIGRGDFPEGGLFKTVNGGITLRVGGPIDADLRAETLNGSITSDFPITLRGNASQRRIRGTIGNGGRSLTLSTVNGSIKLLRDQ